MEAESHTESNNLKSVDQEKNNNTPKNFNIIKKKTKEKELNFQVKYQDEEDFNQSKYISVKKKQKIGIEYQNIDFLDQSQYRFALHPLSDSIQNISPNFKFSEICLVYYYAFETYTCSICLNDNLKVPVITRCGHIFCMVCLITYYNYHNVFLSEIKKSKNPSCPLCKEIITKDKIAFCEIIQSKVYCVRKVEDSPTKNNESHPPILESEVEEDDYSGMIKTSEKGKIIQTSTNNKSGSFSKKSFDSHKPYVSQQRKSNVSETNKSNKSDKEQSMEYSKKSNYTSSATSLITFNLCFRYNFMIYNVNYDQNLSKFKKYFTSRTFAETNFQQTGFSSIFSISLPILLSFYKNCLKDMEKQLQDELFEQEISLDDKRVNSCFECISSIKQKIEGINLNINITQPISNTKEIDFNKFKYFFQESQGDIYFLHPINYLLLITEYKLAQYLPTEITVTFLI